jgi:hypothetical protein
LMSISESEKSEADRMKDAARDGARSGARMSHASVS